MYSETWHFWNGQSEAAARRTQRTRVWQSRPIQEREACDWRRAASSQHATDESPSPVVCRPSPRAASTLHCWLSCAKTPEDVPVVELISWWPAAHTQLAVSHTRGRRATVCPNFRRRGSGFGMQGSGLGLWVSGSGTLAAFRPGGQDRRRTMPSALSSRHTDPSTRPC
eukprot:3932281-Rhodomonas_salina.1